jgi:hypothetical protein
MDRAIDSRVIACGVAGLKLHGFVICIVGSCFFVTMFLQKQFLCLGDDDPSVERCFVRSRCECPI